MILKLWQALNIQFSLKTPVPKKRKEGNKLQKKKKVSDETVIKEKIEYLGLNGLFSNVLSMLSIFELGIGSAIVYNLYKPIADNDVENIKTLMKFYKTAYNSIAIIIIFVGLAIIPFLNYFINDVTVNINITIIYILFLINTVASYVLSYKRSIIYANQKNY